MSAWPEYNSGSRAILHTNTRRSLLPKIKQHEKGDGAHTAVYFDLSNFCINENRVLINGDLCQK